MVSYEYQLLLAASVLIIPTPPGYTTVCVTNLRSPCLLLLQFSGFPFSSEDSKTRLRTLSRLGLLWTSARLGWGIVALTTVVEGWLNEARKSTLFYTIVLVGTLFLASILAYTVLFGFFIVWTESFGHSFFSLSPIPAASFLVQSICLALFCSLVNATPLSLLNLTSALLYTFRSESSCSWR